MYPRAVKRPTRRLQVRWRDEIRKIAGVHWLSKVQANKKKKNLGEPTSCSGMMIAVVDDDYIYFF